MNTCLADSVRQRNFNHRGALLWAYGSAAESWEATVARTAAGTLPVEGAPLSGSLFMARRQCAALTEKLSERYLASAYKPGCSSRFSQDAPGPKGQHEDQNDKGEHHAVGGRVGESVGLGKPKDDRAHGCADNAAHTTNDHHNE